MIIDIYKKTGEKIKLGNRNACVYTKGNRKTKYIKSNKEMVLLSKELKRLKITKKILGGDEQSILVRYGFTNNYEPICYKEQDETINTNYRYKNIITIYENKENNPPTNIIKKHIYSGMNPIYYCSDKATSQFVKNELERLFLNLNDKQNVVKWNIPDSSTVLIIGDIHGDVIALEKVLNKWILEKHITKDIASTKDTPKYNINHGVYIISTGDLIDYGSKSINVLCAMLRLRKDNINNVMLLCGNHETDSLTISGRKQLLFEIKNNHQKNADLINTVLKKIYLIGPDMVALHFENELEGTYFMHGMYPIKYDFETIFNNDEYKSIENLYHENDENDEYNSIKELYHEKKGLKDGVDLGAYPNADDYNDSNDYMIYLNDVSSDTELRHRRPYADNDFYNDEF